MNSFEHTLCMNVYFQTLFSSKCTRFHFMHRCQKTVSEHCLLFSTHRSAYLVRNKGLKILLLTAFQEDVKRNRPKLGAS